MIDLIVECFVEVVGVLVYLLCYLDNYLYYLLLVWFDFVELVCFVEFFDYVDVVVLLYGYDCIGCSI